MCLVLFRWVLVGAYLLKLGDVWFWLLFAWNTARCCWLYGLFVHSGPDATGEDGTYGDDADAIEEQTPGGRVAASEDAVNGCEDVDAQG